MFSMQCWTDLTLIIFEFGAKITPKTHIQKFEILEFAIWKKIKSEQKKPDASKIWSLIKNPQFCPILVKLCENNHLMRSSFSPSFMRIGKKLWILYQWPIFESVLFFSPQTLTLSYLNWPRNGKPSKF